MELNIEIKGMDKLAGATKLIREQVAQELAKGMFASMKRVQQEGQRSIAEGNKSGVLYKRGNTTHRASAPGQAPATDTGRLVNSIIGDVDRTSLSNGILQGTVTAKTLYAQMLEFGTIRMAARPFMRPAFEKSKRWITDRMAQAVKRGMNAKS